MHISNESVEELDRSKEEENLKKVEAALFISGKYMSVQELVALTDVNPLLLKKLLEDLGERYKDKGIEIVNKNNLWKMDVAADYTWMVNRLAGGSSEFTRAEQETLALIAYKQPMKQSIVIKIRGNKAYDHIRKFAELGLVNKKRMGHTSELTLSESFYDYFSLSGNLGDGSEGNSFEIIKKGTEIEKDIGEAIEKAEKEEAEIEEIEESRASQENISAGEEKTLE